MAAQVNRRIVFDVETNNLYPEVDKIWVISTFHMETNETNTWSYPEGEYGYGEALEYLMSAKTLIGHNIVQYDLPVLEMLTEFRRKGILIWDTLILSKLLKPDRPLPDGWTGYPRPHSVEAWAMRLKLDDQKVEQEEWDKFDINMLERCESDVRIQTAIYHTLESDRKK